MKIKFEHFYDKKRGHEYYSLTTVMVKILHTCYAGGGQPIKIVHFYCYFYTPSSLPTLDGSIAGTLDEPSIFWS